MRILKKLSSLGPSAAIVSTLLLISTACDQGNIKVEPTNPDILYIGPA